MRFLKYFAVLVVLAGLSATVSAQEAEIKVVDEVVAQVNDGVITLSRIKREAKDLVDLKVQQGMKREDAQKDVDEKQGQMIADLVNEELLMQKSKEIGIDKEVEAAINQRLLDIMKQQNFKTIAELEEEMRRQNIEPAEMRDLWRKQITSERVLAYEVDRKIYFGLTGKELKDYYEKNKAKFTKPERLTLSEIFLSFAGRDPEATRAKGRDIVKQVRGGADFVKLVLEHSDRPNKEQTKGKADTLALAELDPRYAEPVKNLKAGEVTDPIEVDNIGVTILRVDERTAASSESEYREDTIRLAITNDRRDDGRKKYMTDLRQGAYIKVNESYRPLVSPLLFAEERKSKPGQ